MRKVEELKALRAEMKEALRERLKEIDMPWGLLDFREVCRITKLAARRSMEYAELPHETMKAVIHRRGDEIEVRI